MSVSPKAGGGGQCKCANSCTQKVKVNWQYVPKDGKTNTGNSYINCGGPGPSPFEYWAYAELIPIGKPECSNPKCGCFECDEAKRAALDAVRPDDTEATGPVQWNKEPGGETCSSCPDNCYHASFGNTSEPTLPEPEHTITWSCNCIVNN